MKRLLISIIIFLFGFNTYAQIARESLLKNLTRKSQNGDTLLVHVFVPLCDNDNQGIVPVSRTLGNGLDLKNNLYWGAMYGVKTRLIKSANYRLVSSSNPSNPNVLERIVLHGSTSDSAPVKIVLDAYRGDRMESCLKDFLNESAGLTGTLKSDLVVFNGHNGLMDYPDLDPIYYKPSTKSKEVAVIGCVSYEYFKPYFLKAQVYPLLTTRGLMAPEGYVLEALLNSWIQLRSAAYIEEQVELSYNQYQKCGMKGARWLFKSGW